jgi:3-oxoacyl-[acyl-carrier protein] reductase
VESKEDPVTEQDPDGRPVAVVTGGGRNLGAAISRALAAAGHDVAVAYATDKDAAEGVAAGIRATGAAAAAFPLELAESASATELVRRVTATFGRLDVLVNNAAVRPRRPLLETTDEDWRHVLGVNLDGPFFLSRAAAPALIERGGGSIVHISGLIALQGGGGGGAPIAASKAGLSGLSRALADELGPHGIRSNVVVPGRMDTTRAHPADPETVAAELRATPLRRIGSVEDVAALCVWLASPAAAFVTGQLIHVNGGLVKG